MREIVRQAISDYREFVKENKWVPWIVVAAVILSYGITLSGVRIGIDAEANINDSAAFLDSWYSIGRFSLVFPALFLTHPCVLSSSAGRCRHQGGDGRVFLF